MQNNHNGCKMDVLLFDTLDSGDITITNGDVAMTNGIDTATYICLFGGNSDDPGNSDTSLAWWGNADETDTDKWIRSSFQHLLTELPLTISNLRKFEDAAKQDLQTLIDVGAVEDITATASIPAVDTLKLVLDLDGTQVVYISESEL